MQADVAMLIPNGDFLALTLANPTHLPKAHFVLGDGTEGIIHDTGILEMRPKSTGNKHVVISCGIHGNETAPIEIVQTLVQQLLTGKVSLVQPTLFLIGNPPAINAGTREVTENLNRLFSGKHSEGAGLVNAERQRALQLENAVADFFSDATGPRLHYDLHTAIRGAKFEKFAVYPFLHGKPWSKQQFCLLQAMDVHCVLLMQAPATTFSYYSANRHGAHAFTIELGKVRKFGENDMTRFAKAQQLLTELVSLPMPDIAEFDEQTLHLFAVHRSINKQTDAFTLQFANDVENFTSFALGTVLATDGEIAHRVEIDGEAIIFPNANVAIGQRAMLTVVPTSVSHNLTE